MMSLFFQAALFAVACLTGVAQAAASKASVLLPPPLEAIPEEAAWSMVYAQFGVVGVGVCIVVLVMWRMLNKFIVSNQELNAQLATSQAASIQLLSQSVQRVETAVKTSDLNNTHALDKLMTNLAAVVTRLDKHESRLERHSSRISAMEVEQKIEERSRAGFRPKTLPPE